MTAGKPYKYSVWDLHEYQPIMLWKHHGARVDYRYYCNFMSSGRTLQLTVF